jgi:hypothetical protein
MVAEISASAFSLLSCFICIFFSSLLIAADLFFIFQQIFFPGTFCLIGLVGCVLTFPRLTELLLVPREIQHDNKPGQTKNRFDGTAKSNAP